ncbi:defensin-like protein 2 [Cinnamomum micranthum f. kanehirae]|uniref:Defensin-like protein 2 n=1 Tax=Cinnamomum micranthum f. kanehirae TaxID=337451 RepID=A0A443PQ86_9MAGN|nr:defensin-like protein 2 [Cinnamomum micranthum f. kanehirae]
MGEKGVEARLCESQSHKFEGICIKSSTCAHVCMNEGFPGGRCRGFRRRCFCTKQSPKSKMRVTTFIGSTTNFSQKSEPSHAFA